MSGYIKINLEKKDCRGLYLLSDASVKCITDAKDGSKLIEDTFKIQLRTKINGIRGKKTFQFEKKKITFIKAVEQVSATRNTIHEMLKENGTTRVQKQEETDANVEGEAKTFAEEIKQFILTKAIAVVKRTAKLGR